MTVVHRAAQHCQMLDGGGAQTPGANMVKLAGVCRTPGANIVELGVGCATPSAKHHAKTIAGPWRISQCFCLGIRAAGMVTTVCFFRPALTLAGTSLNFHCARPPHAHHM